MKSKLKKISNWAIGIVMACSIVLLISFENSENKSKRCNKLEIELLGQTDQFYISKEDILKYVTQNGNRPLEGKLLSSIDLTELEEKTKEIKQIETCDAFGDLQGNIHLKVRPYIPYARVLGSAGYKDHYMTNEGVFFPLSKYHAERVLLLSGSYFKRLENLKDVKHTELLALVNTIKENDFWNSQITQMDVNGSGEITMVPLMGEQIIKFGTAEDAEQKLKRLEIFYKKIMATNQWNSFKTVNVSFANQIVCN